GGGRGAGDLALSLRRRSAAERLPPHGAVLPAQLAAVSPLAIADPAQAGRAPAGACAARAAAGRPGARAVDDGAGAGPLAASQPRSARVHGARHERSPYGRACIYVAA